MTERTCGVSIFGLLGIAFVVLKLCGVIDWPWVWVTLPFWGPVALVLIVLGGLMALCIAMGVIALLVGLFKPKGRHATNAFDFPRPPCGRWGPWSSRHSPRRSLHGNSVQPNARGPHNRFGYRLAAADGIGEDPARNTLVRKRAEVVHRGEGRERE